MYCDLAFFSSGPIGVTFANIICRIFALLKQLWLWIVASNAFGVTFCHLPLQEADFLGNTQEFFRYKIAKSQGFRYSSNKVKCHSDSIRVWFGLLESFWFFQTWYSSRFSVDAHRHQVYFGLSFKQVGFWLFHPLELWFITTPL